MPDPSSAPGAKMEARGLNFWYGPKHALKGISMAVQPHEVTAVSGRTRRSTP